MYYVDVRHYYRENILNRIYIDNLEDKYMKMHFLLEIMQQIIDSRICGYENSDICCLYSEIMKKRDAFYNDLKIFIKNVE